jgi:hypothetical protein
MLGENQTVVGKLDEIAKRLGGSNVDDLAVFKNAISDPREELIIRSTKGTLTFAPLEQDGEQIRYGLLDLDIFKLDGTPDGKHLTIWQPLSNEIFGVPPDFEGPWGKPDPIPLIRMTANSKAVWTFSTKTNGVNDSIRATGPANLLLVKLKDGSKLFVISVAAVITGGTGKYEGCTGVKTALGSSFIPKEVEDISKVPFGLPVGGVTVETFRVIKAADIAQQPQNDRPLSSDYATNDYEV